MGTQTLFFCETRYRRRRSFIRTYSHPYERTYTLLLCAPPRDLVQETDSTGHEIDEVTTDASSSTGTSPPTKEYSAFLMRHQSVKSEI
jgi:hypothetical protein